MTGIYEVIDVVRQGLIPSVVPDDAIDVLMAMEVDDPRLIVSGRDFLGTCVRVDRPLVLRRGDRVVVNWPGSPLDGLVAALASSGVAGRPEVKVFIRMLGGRRAVSIPAEKVVLEATLSDEREDLSGEVTLQGSNGVEFGMPFGYPTSNIARPRF
jgi:hypothetical protein